MVQEFCSRVEYMICSTFWYALFVAATVSTAFFFTEFVVDEQVEFVRPTSFRSGLCVHQMPADFVRRCLADKKNG